MNVIVHSTNSQSVHAPSLNAGLMDNDAERYCKEGGAAMTALLLKNQENQCDFFI